MNKFLGCSIMWVCCCIFSCCYIAALRYGDEDFSTTKIIFEGVCVTTILLGIIAGATYGLMMMNGDK